MLHGTVLWVKVCWMKYHEHQPTEQIDVQQLPENPPHARDIPLSLMFPAKGHVCKCRITVTVQPLKTAVGHTVHTPA